MTYDSEYEPSICFPCVLAFVQLLSVTPGGLLPLTLPLSPTFGRMTYDPSDKPATQVIFGFGVVMCYRGTLFGLVPRGPRH